VPGSYQQQFILIKDFDKMSIKRDAARIALGRVKFLARDLREPILDELDRETLLDNERRGNGGEIGEVHAARTTSKGLLNDARSAVLTPLQACAANPAHI
jgi:hypothetical protein